MTSLTQRPRTLARRAGPTARHVAVPRRLRADELGARLRSATALLIFRAAAPAEVRRGRHS